MIGPALALVLCSPLATAPAQAAENPSELARQLLEAGAEAFDRKDAFKLASTYREDAELTLTTITPDGFSEQVHTGRSEIQKLYSNLFLSAGPTESRNVVEYARFAGDDLLIIGGTFESSVGSGILLQFVQVRVRGDDGSWKIADMQLFPISQGG